MKDRKEWFENYGLILKIFSGLVLFIWLGGLNIFIFLREDPAGVSYNSTLSSYDRPPEYSGPKFEDWKNRQQKAKAESEAILKRAKAIGDNYTIKDYFRDYNDLMDIEDKYHIYVTCHFGPLQELVMLRDRQGIFARKNTLENEENNKFITTVRDRADLRNGMAVSTKDAPDSKILFIAAAKWLSIVYLKFMLFWLFMYMLRFAERDKSMRRFQFHHHELGRFVNSQEPFPGFLSLKEEILLCPIRLITRLVLWPKYCFAYPHYEDTAEHIRYLRLKARYLQGKALAYQLTEVEDQRLHAQARLPIKEFNRALRELRELEISPRLVKKSLAVAYLSLLLGVLLQPVIILAAKSSSKMNDHFYGGQSRIEMISSHDCNVRDGPVNNFPSDHDNHWFELPAVISRNLEIYSLGLWEFIKPKGSTLKIKKLPDKILHIPISLAV